MHSYIILQHRRKVLTWITTLSSAVNPLSKFRWAASLSDFLDNWRPSVFISYFEPASVISRFTIMDRSPTRSSCKTESGLLLIVSFTCILESMRWRIAATALKIETSTNWLWSKKAFRSRTTLSSSVLQGRQAKIAKSVAHGRRSNSPFLPQPPPLPPQFSSSVGSNGKSDGESATDGGASHVFARNPYGRLPNWGNQKNTMNYLKSLCIFAVNKIRF